LQILNEVKITSPPPPRSDLPSGTQATTNKTTPWPESGSELYRPNDRRLSAKLMPIFVDRGCHVVSVTDP
jgi:hypothetical protein